MTIRLANENDIDSILDLLSQVLELHYNLRPDLFVKGKTKYDKTTLKSMLNDINKHIYVAIENDKLIGYCFCIIKENKADNHIANSKTLYIDDLCVDKEYRSKHIGQNILDYIKEEAKRLNADYITLNVWEGNDTAKLFYEHNGFKIRKTEMEYKV